MTKLVVVAPVGGVGGGLVVLDGGVGGYGVAKGGVGGCLVVLDGGVGSYGVAKGGDGGAGWWWDDGVMKMR